MDTQIPAGQLSGGHRQVSLSTGNWHLQGPGLPGGEGSWQVPLPTQA